MIRSLRARHRTIWVALAILLPLLFAIALMVRHPRPSNPDATIPRPSEGAAR